MVGFLLLSVALSVALSRCLFRRHKFRSAEESSNRGGGGGGSMTGRTHKPLHNTRKHHKKEALPKHWLTPNIEPSTRNGDVPEDRPVSLILCLVLRELCLHMHVYIDRKHRKPGVIGYFLCVCVCVCVCCVCVCERERERERESSRASESVY